MPVETEMQEYGEWSMERCDRQMDVTPILKAPSKPHSGLAELEIVPLQLKWEANQNQKSPVTESLGSQCSQWEKVANYGTFWGVSQSKFSICFPLGWNINSSPLTNLSAFSCILPNRRVWFGSFCFSKQSNHSLPIVTEKDKKQEHFGQF